MTNTEPKRRDSTAVFVTRSRSLNVGGWVVLSLIVGALAGLVWGLMRGVSAYAPLVVGALYGLLFVGGFLALVVVTVDWLVEKKRRPSAK